MNFASRIVPRGDGNQIRIQVVFVPMRGDEGIGPRIGWIDRRCKGAIRAKDSLDRIGKVSIQIDDSPFRCFEDEARPT